MTTRLELKEKGLFLNVNLIGVQINAEIQEAYELNYNVFELKDVRLAVSSKITFSQTVFFEPINLGGDAAMSSLVLNTKSYTQNSHSELLLESAFYRGLNEKRQKRFRQALRKVIQASNMVENLTRASSSLNPQHGTHSGTLTEDERAARQVWEKYLGRVNQVMDRYKPEPRVVDISALSGSERTHYEQYLQEFPLPAWE